MTSTVPSLHPGAKEHYEDALAYQARYASRQEDVEFYLRQVRRENAVLEYGAGAGRLTIPLARKCGSVVAVDPSQPMLEALRHALSSLPVDIRKKVRVVSGDMRTFRTSKRFDVVIAGFHTLCHLYSHTDVSSFLKLAYRHLRPGGRLVFDLPLPRIDMDGYDMMSQVRVTEMEAPGGTQLLTQRWFHPAEMRMHLHYAGFRRIRLASDFSTDPIERETSVYTVVATRPNEKV